MFQVLILHLKFTLTHPATAWYPDSGATHHVSSDLSNLTTSSEYFGGNTLHLGNYYGLPIAHIGDSFVHCALNSSLSKSFFLKNLLHVPTVSKNLLNVSHFAQDNQVFFEFHPSFCVVRDQVSR